MRIRVLFFGAVKDVVGAAGETVELAPGSNVASVLELYSRRFPALERHRASLLFSRNREFVDRAEPLSEGDELGFLPPVSGGAPEVIEARKMTERQLCRLTRNAIDPRALVQELQRGEDGAVVVFEGVTRNHSKGRATRFLEYEAYEPMALEKMTAIANDLLAAFPIDRIGITHRLGHLEIGEASVVIVVTSEHRKPAFDACREAIDRLKRVVPIWKKEFFVDGEVWVEGEQGTEVKHG
jgi:MoaE-MoaD fusion protein